MTARTSLIALWIAACLASCFGSAVAADPAVDPDTDPAGGQIVQRTTVPFDGPRQGEVRIVRSDGEIVVQTLLHSKVLRRVAGKIAKKEAAAWPAGSPGSAESERYVAALRSIVDTIRLEGRKNADEDGDRHRDLRIDFLVREGRGQVVLSGAEVTEEGMGLRLVASRPPVESLDLSVDYVQRNMRLIVSDSFRTTVEEADRLLATAGGDPEP